MHIPVLDPQTKRCLVWFVSDCNDSYLSLLISSLFIRNAGTIKAYNSNSKVDFVSSSTKGHCQYRFRDLFRDNELCSKRNWFFASTLGVGFLFSLVFLTSLLAERVIGPKVVNNSVLKEILDSSNISRVAYFTRSSS
ncbi:unnamed protein product [Citrullus colocynthis]|uniref:Uncharacterized protein n=1 Tax=Citrullus colocynthis TaxID=252529 RepID=A0ABP0YT92_9ROSI